MARSKPATRRARSARPRVRPLPSSQRSRVLAPPRRKAAPRKAIPRSRARSFTAFTDLQPGALSAGVVAAMCPGAPRANIETYLPALAQAMAEVGLSDRSMLLMAVATIRAETGRFAPLDEYRSRFNTSPGAAPPYFDLYDHRADLGNRGPHDGAAFKGRGFVQLTGRANYAQYGRALGLGTRLETEPELANDALIAARVLARFLKDREARIQRALAARDFAQARRCVNGGHHGLAEFTASFLAGERLLA